MNSIASSNIGNDALDNDNDNMTDMSDIINQSYDNSKYSKLVVTKEGEIDPSHLLITEGITIHIRYFYYYYYNYYYYFYYYYYYY